MKRRQFLQVTAATGSAALLYGCGGSAPRSPAAPPRTDVSFSDPSLRALADVALDAARSAGATYADIRIADYRTQSIRTREQRVTDVRDGEDRGFGVRVIASGTWGFAASHRIDRDEIARVARRAVAIAKANSALQREPVQLAPVGTYVDVWNTPIEKDPFSVSLQDKIDALLSINAQALALDGVDYCSSWMAFVREHKFFASTEGSYIEQTLHRNNPGFTVTSVDRRRGGFETRNSYTDPQGRGYEYIETYPWLDDARQAAEDVVAKHTAPSVEPGKWDLILHPTHLWLTIHESVGHPTELDRALGMEANFAGTSFLTPDKLGTFQFGSEIVNFRADKTSVGSLATCGYDDDGDKTTEWDLVKNGVFVDYQITRDQAHWIGRKRGYACSYAQSWKDVPFQRMPNVNLLPGDKPLTLAQLIAGTDRAILIKGRGSYSIDHQRYNFQFGGQTFWKVEGGKITGMVKDVAYQSRTPDFWRACDAICSADEYYVGGSFYDGKGEPSQSNAVSHGCPPARFRNIDVINTGRSV
ncbi:MAG: TldD/PmbA family protein [Deltaproteobacteria bacterium]|nr:MAG: TldD/PmbA family protein [Deltaproteobacteria bacterium]